MSNSYYFYVRTLSTFGTGTPHYYHVLPYLNLCHFFAEGFYFQGKKEIAEFSLSLFHFLPDFYAIVKGTLFPYLYSNHVPLQLHSSKGLMVELWPRRCGDFRFALLLLCFSVSLFFCSCVPLCFWFV